MTRVLAENSIPPSLAAKLSTGLVRWRWVWFPLAVVLTAIGFWKARELTFDRSIESLYAADNPHLADYRESKSLFGGDEFIIVTFRDPNLLDESEGGLSVAARRRLEALAQSLSVVPGIRKESTQDLAFASSPRNISVDLSEIPSILHGFVKRVTQGYTLPDDILHELVRGILIGRDNATTAVVLRLMTEAEAPLDRAKTIALVRRRVAEFGQEHGFETHVVGEPVQVLEMFRYVEEDGRLLFAVSLGLLGVVLLMLLRSVRWVLLPVLIVIAAIAWTEALLVVSGVRLSMVSSMLNSLVTIIGVATVMHVAVHLRDRQQDEPRIALTGVLSELLPPIAWTCLTTAAGFAALLCSHITPVRSFGTMTALATVLVLIAVIWLLPGGVLLAPSKRAAPAGVSGRRLSRGLMAATDRTLRRRWIVVIGFALVTVFCGFGFSRLQVETDFSKNFRSDSPIVRGLNFVEGPNGLGGAGTWEVNFPAPQKLTKAYLDKIEELTALLREKFTQPNGSGEISKVLSITDGLAAVPVRPYVTNTLDKQLAVLGQVQPEFLPTLYNPSAGRMRIMLRAPERQDASAKLDLIRRVGEVSQVWVEENLSDQIPEPRVKTTGLFVLLAFLIQSLLGDQLVSFLLATAAIGAMMWLAFRSLRVALAALVPNLFPIVFVIGSMGWLGLPINIATAMIASVSIGLTVDSSVHYISGFRRARAAGADHAEALRQTHGSVGRALVFSNCALIAGFSVLTLSHFIPLIYFGVLVSVAMLGGLAGNLLLLPVLLSWTER